MIRRLLAPFDLAQVYARIRGGIGEHAAEQIVAHEMGARARSEITATGQELHGLQVDFLVAANGVVHSMARFGKGRRIEDDEVVIVILLFCQLRQKVEDVGLLGCDDGFEAVAADVFLRHFYGFGRDVDGGNAGSAALGRIEGKCTCMGEAIEDVAALGELGYSQAVIFLDRKSVV